MKRKINSSLILGACTLLLFAITPTIVDLISPPRSLGEAIGDNAKDLLDTLEGKKVTTTKTTASIVSNVLTLIAFILCGLTLYFSISQLPHKENRLINIAAIALCLIGLAFYFTYLTMSMVVLFALVLAVLTVFYIINIA